MSGGVISRAEFPKLMEPTLAAAFFAAYEGSGLFYPKYWDVRDSIKQKEEMAETVIPSEIPQVGEGGMFARSELLMGRSQTWVHATYKLELVQTQEVTEDNLYPAALRAQKALSIVARRTIEKLSAQNYTHGITAVTTPDGKTAFAPDHPVLYPSGTNPTSWSNVLSGRTFSSETIKAMKILMRKHRDERGDILEAEMTDLFVGPDLGEEAREMYGSDGTYDRTDRATNQTKKGIRKVEEIPYFQYTEHAYAATQIFGRDPEQAGNIMFMRKEPEYHVREEPATENIVHRVRFRASWNWLHPRGNVAAFS